MAYPHIIPADYHPRCFYEDFDDLVVHLSEAIVNIEQTRRFSLRSIVAQYDWGVTKVSWRRKGLGGTTPQAPRPAALSYSFWSHPYDWQQQRKLYDELFVELVSS